MHVAELTFNDIASSLWYVTSLETDLSSMGSQTSENNHFSELLMVIEHFAKFNKKFYLKLFI